MAILNPNAPVNEILKTTGYECPQAALNKTLDEVIHGATDPWVQLGYNLNSVEIAKEFITYYCHASEDDPTLFYFPAEIAGILKITIGETATQYPVEAVIVNDGAEYTMTFLEFDTGNEIQVTIPESNKEVYISFYSQM